MKFSIPNGEELKLNTIVLDLNGTLTVGGKIVDGVKERLAKLKKLGFRIVLFSGDTSGNGQKIANNLDIEFIKTGNAKDKEREIKKLNPETSVAIGNGLIDLKKMKVAKLSIVTLQAEGAHTKTILVSDIVVPTINNALDLFIDSDRLIATLRS